MKLTNIFSMLGGLALFLYGMNMMSNGLELAAGNKMKTILEKLTSNRILGVLVGALVTAIIQSSSATTVMVVGFVNSGLMSLTSAVWVIMGANIGTTITGQLIAIDITAIAPLIAFIGVAMIVFFKSKKLDAFGSVIGGLGILFIAFNTYLNHSYYNVSLDNIEVQQTMTKESYENTLKKQQHMRERLIYILKLMIPIILFIGIIIAVLLFS